MQIRNLSGRCSVKWRDDYMRKDHSMSKEKSAYASVSIMDSKMDHLSWCALRAGRGQSKSLGSAFPIAEELRQQLLKEETHSIKKNKKDIYILCIFSCMAELNQCKLAKEIRKQAHKYLPRSIDKKVILFLFCDPIYQNFHQSLLQSPHRLLISENIAAYRNWMISTRVFYSRRCTQIHPLVGCGPQTSSVKGHWLIECEMARLCSSQG